MCEQTEGMCGDLRNWWIFSCALGIRCVHIPLLVENYCWLNQNKIWFWNPPTNQAILIFHCLTLIFPTYRHKLCPLLLTLPPTTFFINLSRFTVLIQFAFRVDYLIQLRLRICCLLVRLYLVSWHTLLKYSSMKIWLRDVCLIKWVYFVPFIRKYILSLSIIRGSS